MTSFKGDICEKKGNKTGEVRGPCNQCKLKAQREVTRKDEGQTQKKDAEEVKEKKDAEGGASGAAAVDMED